MHFSYKLQLDSKSRYTSTNPLPQHQLLFGGNCWNCKGFESTGCIEDSYFASPKAAARGYQWSYNAEGLFRSSHSSKNEHAVSSSTSIWWKIRPFEKCVVLRTRSQAGFPHYQGKWKYERSCLTDSKFGTTRVFELTDGESAKNDSATTQVQNLAKIPVDTNVLQKILETVEKQGSVSACSNLLPFQKPEKSQISLHGS